MTKVRIHNEYFRPVFRRTVYDLIVRNTHLIDEILSRENNTLTREFLEQPYRSIIGEESNRKSCPTCRRKINPLTDSIWSWGEYHNAKWRTVKHFCEKCYSEEVLPLLIEHRNECGCDFNLIGYRCELPGWLRLPSKCQIITTLSKDIIEKDESNEPGTVPSTDQPST